MTTKLMLQMKNHNLQLLSIRCKLFHDDRKAALFSSFCPSFIPLLGPKKTFLKADLPRTFILRIDCPETLAFFLCLGKLISHMKNIHVRNNLPCCSPHGQLLQCQLSGIVV